MASNRREWLRQTGLATLGLGLSLRSIANEEGMLRSVGREMGLVNLGSNENPYGISPLAREAITSMIADANRYQFNVKSLQHFKQELGEHYKTGDDRVLVTAGSGEGLILLARYFNSGNIVTANPTFGILPNTARKLGTELIEVPLTNEKVHDLKGMLSAMNADTRLVYVVNPANPTATVVNAAELREFVIEASKKAVVLVDEAYHEFIDPEGKDSMMHQTFTNPNLLVIKTFSKIHGMAGLRVGFITGHPSIIGKLEQSYFGSTQSCVSNLSLAAALASLKDKKHCEESRQKNEAARTFAFNEIRKMGFRSFPSYTNFLYFHLGDFNGNFSQEMLARNFIVRSSQYADGQWCRASIGTLDEMKSFCQALKSLKA